MKQLHAAAECAASLERMLSHVERDAAAEERGALLARLRQAEATAAAAEAEGSAVRAVAAEAETVSARALEEREEAVQRWREMQGELEQAHKLRAASVSAATAADIRARAAEFDVAAAERKASEAMATAESAGTAGAAVGAAEVESEAVVVVEGAVAGARPRKQTRRGGRATSSDSAGTAAAETAPPPPVDERNYQVPTASQRAPGIEVNSVFVSKVRHCYPCGRARCHSLRVPPTTPRGPSDYSTLPRCRRPAHRRWTAFRGPTRYMRGRRRPSTSATSARSTTSTPTGRIRTTRRGSARRGPRGGRRTRWCDLAVEMGQTEPSKPGLC